MPSEAYNVDLKAGPLWNPSKSVRSARGRLDLPDPDLCSLRPKVVPPSGLSLSPSCTTMNRPRTYMYDGNRRAGAWHFCCNRDMKMKGPKIKPSNGNPTRPSAADLARLAHMN